MLAEIFDKIGFDFQLAFFHTLNFLIVFFVLVKFAFPKLKKTIDERNQKIEIGLENFASSQKVLEDSKNEAKNIISQGEKEKQEILKQAEINKQEKLNSAENKALEILKEANLKSETLQKESYLKSGEIFLQDLPKILQAISEKAFDGKITPEIQKNFVEKVFSNQYGK